MNVKQNLEKAKQKIKFYAPEIITVTAIVAGVGAYLYYLSQQNTEEGERGFRLKEVTREMREMLMADENFKLLELSEDEYLLARDYPTED